MEKTQNKSQIAFLENIPPASWNTIMKKDPVWIYLKEFHTTYQNGRFSVLLMMLALNAYQLKGKAEQKYWSLLQKHIHNYKTPTNLSELKKNLYDFYKKERLPKGKIKRLSTFLTSKLAQKLWNSDPKNIANQFQLIWDELATTMKQKKTAKTIVFSMKCLGMSLYINQQNSFDFTSIPIPVDSRIERFTKKLLDTPNIKNCVIQSYWDTILTQIQTKHPQISMIHLDSLLWQIEPLNKDTITPYCQSMKIEFLKDSFLNIL